MGLFQKRFSRLQAEYATSEQRMKERIHQLETLAGIRQTSSNSLSVQSQKGPVKKHWFREFMFRLCKIIQPTIKIM